MMRDILQETLWSLSANKVRSGLTILGIVIGIASVITMISIGQGANASIQANIASIGSNLIVVTPGASRGSTVSQGRGSAQTLTVSDADAIRSEVANVKAVAADVSRRYQVTATGTNTNTQVIGTVPDYLSVRNVTVDFGSFFTDQHVKSAAKVAVLGPAVRDDLFGADVDPTGRSVRINNVSFLVLGVTKTKGGSGFSNPDDAVYIPIVSAQHYLSGENFVSTISVAALNQVSMAAVQQDITSLLLKRHSISDPNLADFNILNQNDIVAAASSVTGTFTVLLASIAGISLLVGGIGIMNMMLTSVTERTREIGLRKAVGIKKKQISLQFLTEAATLTFLGGAVGILLGWVASFAISSFTTLPTQVSFSSVLLAVGVSAGVGIVFGIYPARRAANLSPIEALRYE